MTQPTQHLADDREQQIRTLDLQPLMNDRSAAVISGHLASLLGEIDRLRADAASELLPAWEAVYEPGNVSNYLIGYTNDEDPAKAAAEAWLRSQKDDIGRLEWVPEERLATGRYDRWFELVEHHDDGIPTGPGLVVRRRAVEETHVVADDSSDPEHIDDCPGCAPASA